MINITRAGKEQIIKRVPRQKCHVRFIGFHTYEVTCQKEHQHVVRLEDRGDELFGEHIDEMCPARGICHHLICAAMAREAFIKSRREAERKEAAKRAAREAERAEAQTHRGPHGQMVRDHFIEGRMAMSLDELITCIPTWEEATLPGATCMASARTSPAEKERSQEMPELTYVMDASAPALEGSLGENEYYELPADLPPGARHKKVVSRNGRRLAKPIYVVTIPEKKESEETMSTAEAKTRKGAAKKEQPSRKGARASHTNGEGKHYWCGSLEQERVQDVLKRINKHTKERPLERAKLEGQYPKRVANMLADEGLVVKETTDAGVVFYAK